MGTVTVDCGALRIDLGAYVIGALDPADRAALERHLATCPACQEELTRLAGLPALLGRLRPDQLAPPAPSTEGLAERAVVALRRRRRSVARRLASVAAAVAVLAGGGVAAATTLGGSAPAGTVVAATDAGTHVAASVRMRTGEYGTALTLDLRGVRPREWCKLVAVSRSGERDTAASWIAAYDGEADVHGATAIPQSQLASLEVIDATGATLVSVPV